MASLATYKIIAVRPHGVFEKKTRGAPSESSMIAWALNRRAAAVIRYFPSKRGWRIIDLRKTIAMPMSNAFGRPITAYRGHVRGTKYYATEDAAVMVAMHMIGCDP
jgi:hypothetical protein